LKSGVSDWTDCSRQGVRNAASVAFSAILKADFGREWLSSTVHAHTIHTQPYLKDPAEAASPETRCRTLLLEVKGENDVAGKQLMRQRHVAFAMLFLGLSIAPPAMGQINPFRSGRSETRLTKSDLELLEASVSQLNRDPRLRVGAQTDWSNPATGSHGRSVVTRIFSDGQRPCHEMRHEAYPLGSAPVRTYSLTWCRTSDGQWKIKS